MTIPATTSTIDQYDGNGVSATFDYSYKITAEADIWWMSWNGYRPPDQLEGVERIEALDKCGYDAGCHLEAEGE